MKKLTTLILLCFAAGIMVAQSSEGKSSFAIGVGVSGSTNGLGGNVVVSWNDKLALRLGYEKLDLYFEDALTFDQDDFSFNVSPTVKAGGISAIIDWYFLRSMYLAVGVVNTEMNLSALIKSDKPLKIGDIEYSPDEMGEMRLAVLPQNKLAPYVGIGFGRNISKNNRMAMSFELGAYHTGSYVIDASGTELFEPNGDPANQESIQKLNETLKGFSWSGIYPVIKLGISYKIWKN